MTIKFVNSETTSAKTVVSSSSSTSSSSSSSPQINPPATNESTLSENVTEQQQATDTNPIEPNSDEKR
jgi:hypothetical protein